MTIEEFVSINKVGKNTVVGWIKKGLIPGANIDNNYVPDSVRKPYTKARAKTSDAIYSSIVKASKNRCHVLPKLYGICPDEFNHYIQVLEKEGYIESRISDGITYYDATLKSCALTDRQVNNIGKFLSIVVEATAYGTTKVLLDHNL